MSKPRTRSAQTLHNWRVYKVRKKLERLGHVQAATKVEAINTAAAEFHIPDFDRHRIIVKRQD